jgi:hypothetical protein
VQAGQVLVRLDDIQSDSTTEAQRAQRWALDGAGRPLGRRDGQAGRPVAFPPELLESQNPARATPCAASAKSTRRAPPA